MGNRGQAGVRQHFISFLNWIGSRPLKRKNIKYLIPIINIFLQTPDLLNPQNPHPKCALHFTN